MTDVTFMTFKGSHEPPQEHDECDGAEDCNACLRRANEYLSRRSQELIDANLLLRAQIENMAPIRDSLRKQVQHLKSRIKELEMVPPRSYAYQSIYKNS